MSSNNNSLRIALPAKGRLHGHVGELFANAGLPIVRRDDRRYLATIDGAAHVEIRLLASAEIAREVGNGAVHVGITGEDLLRETWSEEADTRLIFARKLDFGPADVVVAVPDGWLDVVSMADLEDVAGTFRMHHRRPLRVATKYANLTRCFFAAHSLIDYRIIGSLGATEGAPAQGAADLIVDITTTGSTLAANGLRILSDGVILQSAATIAVNRQACRDARVAPALCEVVQAIGGREAVAAIAAG